MTILLLLSSLALGLLLWSRRGSALDRAARELRVMTSATQSFRTAVTL